MSTLKEIILNTVKDIKSQEKLGIKNKLLKVVSSIEGANEVKLLSARLKADPYSFTLTYRIEGNTISIFHTLIECCQAVDSSVFGRLVNLNYRGEVKYLIIIGHRDTEGDDIVDCNVVITQVGYYTLGTDTSYYKKSITDGFMSTVNGAVSDATTLALIYERPVTYLYEKNKPVFYGFNDLGEIEVQIDINEEQTI